MRGVPDRHSVAKEDDLRRFVPHPEPGFRLVRQAAMALDRDHVVRRLVRHFGDVRVEGVERFAADAAGAAVLENQDGPLARLGNSGFQRGGIGECLELRC